MRTMTATEASRAFAALLDEVERGETIIITRGGRRIATVGPASKSSGAQLIEMLATHRVDEGFARDVDAARSAVTLEGPAWPAD
jgi:prevent-host-death family protein